MAIPERYSKALEVLIENGLDLQLALSLQSQTPADVARIIKKLDPDPEVAKELVAKLPSFVRVYQTWYSESKALIGQILPDRLADFVRHYEKPKSRKELNADTYRIEDYLQGISVTRGPDSVVVGRDAAIPHFTQQLAILEAARARFTSSLFDIRHIELADLFDSELESAKELLKRKFRRAAGAVAGVVLEKHLKEVCRDHAISLGKKNPTIGDFNDTLKAASIVDVPQWRFIQLLADIRNLCDHDKDIEPSDTQVSDLLEGVEKVIKTVF